MADDERRYPRPPAPMTTRGPILTEELREEARALIVEAVQAAHEVGVRRQLLRDANDRGADLPEIERAEAAFLEAVSRETKALLNLEDKLEIRGLSPRVGMGAM